MVQGPMVPPINGFPGFGAGGAPFRGDVEPAMLANLVLAKGLDVVWEKSAPCPNRLGGDIDRHSNNCPYCHKGIVYFDKQDIKALLSSMDMRENYFPGGRFDAGNARITVLPENKITYWDRITLPNSRVRFYELVYRNKALDYDTLKYSSLQVHNAFTITSDGLTSLTEGVDFVVEDKKVFWHKKRVPVGSFYSIVYDRLPVYIILDMLSWIRQSPIMKNGSMKIVDLPISAIAKLEFFEGSETKGTPSSGNDVEDY